MSIISVLTVVCTIGLDLGKITSDMSVGTPLFGQKINSDGDPAETTVVRAGIFDDIQMLNDRKPDAEIFTDRRLAWVSPFEGAVQFSSMP